MAVMVKTPLVDATMEVVGAAVEVAVAVAEEEEEEVVVNKFCGVGKLFTHLNFRFFFLIWHIFKFYHTPNFY
jgi:hypothetical protein